MDEPVSLRVKSMQILSHTNKIKENKFKYDKKESSSEAESESDEDELKCMFFETPMIWLTIYYS